MQWQMYALSDICDLKQNRNGKLHVNATSEIFLCLCLGIVCFHVTLDAGSAICVQNADLNCVEHSEGLVCEKNDVKAKLFQF